MSEIVEILRAISPGDWYGYDRYQAGKFEAGFLLDRGQEPELREFARLNASGLAEQIGNILARAHEAADTIETLTAENKRMREVALVGLDLAVSTVAFHGRDAGTDRQERTFSALSALAKLADQRIRAAIGDAS